jgi:5-methylcytosine-specific restriction endonuclease McrA
MSQDRKILYKKYNHRYKLFCPDKRNRYICFYCGLPAPTLDHVPPLNKVDDLLMEFEILIYTKVPACNECNRIASDEPHTDIYERQKYIKKS